MKILAIETSCDETSLAIVECTGGVKRPARNASLPARHASQGDAGRPASQAERGGQGASEAGGPQFKVLKNLISSQIKIHRPFGGVVPNLAKREHIVNLPKLFKQLDVKYHESNDRLIRDIDAVAVTVGPGLEPALWAGIEFAKDLAVRLRVPLLGANHMEGHVYSILLSQNNSKLKTQNSKRKSFQSLVLSLKFPAVGLVVSGGHTILVKMDSYTEWKNLGETRDDAAGEAFDKVARLLGLKYPGGPEIAELAQKGNPKAINFPRPMIDSKDYDFSFSGLKTAVLYYLRDNSPFPKGSTSPLARGGISDIAASFQQAVIDVLIKKTMRAAQQYNAKMVFVCGGVAANCELRHQLIVNCERSNVRFIAPTNEFNTDNAAMIAAAAYLAKLRGKKYRMIADSSLTL